MSVTGRRQRGERRGWAVLVGFFVVFSGFPLFLLAVVLAGEERVELPALLALGLFALLGLWGLKWALRKRPSARPADVAADGAADIGRVGARASGSRGAVMQQPKGTGRGWRFGGLLFAAAFWNGVVSIFVNNEVERLRAGEASWAPALFLVPFVLIGLGLLVATGHAGLRLLNPTPRLTLTPSAVPLGGSATVDWQISGRVERLRRLTITLVGVESASFQDGGSTRTERSTFASIPVASVSHRSDMATGTASFTVPADLMHSFEAPSNRVTWALRLAGTIPGWPDIAEDFPFEVLPHQPAAAAAAEREGLG